MLNLLKIAHELKSTCDARDPVEIREAVGIIAPCSMQGFGVEDVNITFEGCD